MNRCIVMSCATHVITFLILGCKRDSLHVYLLDAEDQQKSDTRSSQYREALTTMVSQTYMLSYCSTVKPGMASRA